MAAALCAAIAGSASAQKPPPAPDALQAYLQKGNLYDSLEQYKQQVTQQLQALEDEMGPIEAEAEGLCMPRDRQRLNELRLQAGDIASRFDDISKQYRSVRRYVDDLARRGRQTFTGFEETPTTVYPNDNRYWASVEKDFSEYWQRYNRMRQALDAAGARPCAQPQTQTTTPPPPPPPPAPLLMTVTRPPTPPIEVPPQPARFCSEDEKAAYLQTLADLKAAANDQIRKLMVYQYRVDDTIEALQKIPPSERWTININGSIMPVGPESIAALTAERTWARTLQGALYNTISVIQQREAAAAAVLVVDCGPGTGTVPPPLMPGVLDGLVRPVIGKIIVPPFPPRFCSAAEKDAFLQQISALNRQALAALSALNSYQVAVQKRIDLLYSNPFSGQPPVSKLVINGQTIPYSVEALNALHREWNWAEIVEQSIHNVLGTLLKAHDIPVVDCGQPQTTPQPPPVTPPPPLTPPPPPETPKAGPFYYSPPYNSPFYNAPVYNAPYYSPLEPLLYNTPFYNAPFDYEDGWYFTPKAGLSIVPQQTFTFHFPDGSDSTKVKFSKGYDVGLRVGERVGPWRVEGEFNYRSNDIRMPSDLGSEFSGGTQAYTFLGNAIYDFQTPFLGGVTPHIGAGIGFAHVATQEKFGGFTALDSSDTTFAYQAIAGLRVPFTPNLSLDVDYRYLGTPDLSLKSPSGTRISQSYSSHTLLFSLTYKFGMPTIPPPIFTPPPPPPPPPGAALPQRQASPAAASPADKSGLERRM